MVSRESPRTKTQTTAKALKAVAPAKPKAKPQKKQPPVIERPKRHWAGFRDEARLIAARDEQTATMKCWALTRWAPNCDMVVVGIYSEEYFAELAKYEEILCYIDGEERSEKSRLAEQWQKWLAIFPITVDLSVTRNTSDKQPVLTIVGTGSPADA